MYKKALTRLLVAGIIIIYGVLTFVSGDDTPPAKKNILLLNSYNEGYVWTDGIVAAVEDKIQDSRINANIDIEYMNTKQIYDERYFDKLYELYRYKYSSRKYDVIIASDDDAYNFLLKYRDRLFPGVPVVFCGVNDKDKAAASEKRGFVGMVEDTGVDAAVDVIRTIHPGIRRIHVITDKTTTGKLVVKDIMSTSAKHPSVDFTIEQTDNINEILSGLTKLESNSAVILAPTSVKGEDGNFLSIDETCERVVQHSKAPVYGLWDFYMGSGVVGSKVSSLNDQSDTVAKIALALLNGQSVENFTTTYNLSRQFAFDYNQMKKFNIKKTSLPSGSKIINKPMNSYNFSSNMLWGFVTIFLLAMAIINLLLLSNIKKRRMAEEALQQSEGVIRATLNSTAEGILVTSLDKKIIDYNPLFIRMWHFTEDDVNRKDLNAMFNYALRCLKNPKEHFNWSMRCYTNAKPAFDTVYLQDGRVFEVYSEALVIQEKMHGRVWCFKDITARKHVETELQKSEERYRRLVELSPDAIYMAVDGKNIFSNAAGVELLGAESEGEIYGKSVENFVHDSTDSLDKDYMAGEAEKNKALPLVEMRLKRMDGTFIDVEASTTVFDYNGHNAMLSIVRDITERKEAELLKKRVEEKTKQLNEAWEYDKLKTEFFANISHELRTPINVILGAQKLFEVLLEGVDLGSKREKIIKYINMMRQNCYRLTRLVNNLIDITRIDAGFFNINLKNYDIVNIVECITLSVAEYVQEKGINLVFDTQIEEKTIACDADKIERIMLNLLSNAIKFTSKGGSINVNIVEDDKDIIISVGDTGIGIPEEKQKTVFDRFVQVDKSFVRNREGSGIGLSIVKSLVDLHGGSIELTSEMDKGTTFEIRLPIVLVAEDEAAATADATYQNPAERINVEFSDIYFD
jgi:PAS domain S-box-containing protein